MTAFAPTSITVPAVRGLRLTLRIVSLGGDCHISLYAPRTAKYANTTVAFAFGEVQQIRLADLGPEETPAIWLGRTVFDIPVASWKKLAAWLPKATRHSGPAQVVASSAADQEPGVAAAAQKQLAVLAGGR